jgi:hypothetical protein
MKSIPGCPRSPERPPRPRPPPVVCRYRRLPFRPQTASGCLGPLRRGYSFPALQAKTTTDNLVKKRFLFEKIILAKSSIFMRKKNIFSYAHYIQSHHDFSWRKTTGLSLKCRVNFCSKKTHSCPKKCPRLDFERHQSPFSTVK